jgi:hypothetical protein
MASLGTVAPVGCWVFAGVCFLGAMACTDGPIRLIAGRILCAIVFLTASWYLVDQIQNVGQSKETRYKRSQPNLPNAIFVFVAFGIPCALYAATGSMGKWFFWKK